MVIMVQKRQRAFGTGAERSPVVIVFVSSYPRMLQVLGNLGVGVLMKEERDLTSQESERSILQQHTYTHNKLPVIR